MFPARYIVTIGLALVVALALFAPALFTDRAVVDDTVQTVTAVATEDQLAAPFQSADLAKVHDALRALTEAIAALTEAVGAVARFLDALPGLLASLLRVAVKVLIATIVLTFLFALVARLLLRTLTSTAYALDPELEVGGHKRKRQDQWIAAMPTTSIRAPWM